MVRDFDAADAVGDGIADRCDAWAFIEAFAAAWYTPLTEVDGVDEADLQQAEDRLGHSLPTALREAYRLFGGRPELFEHQDPMLPPSDLFVHEVLGGVLVFRNENQGCAFWGVRVLDLGEPDPPVVVRSRDGWRPFMDRVSPACVELLLSEALVSEWSLYNACELPTDTADTVRRTFRQVALPEYPMWTGDDDSPVHWFSAPGLLLRLDGLAPYNWLHARGQTPAHLAAACGAIPGRWAHSQGTESVSGP
ncbi:UNVERIFIED_CONTAM: hypothetical protein RKD43_006115 [Streptomyces graminofaciens]